MTDESYPKNWKHCTIHLNPATGEMHSDGDHSVREWIESKLNTEREKVARAAKLADDWPTFPDDPDAVGMTLGDAIRGLADV